MTETPSEDILSRIRKLFALAHDAGATEAEASAALAKANESLLRHNLSADAIAAERHDDRPAKVEDDKIRLGRREGWQHRLLVFLASQNWCYPFYSGEWIYFVGRSTNVAVTREMFNWIAPQVERLADEAWREFSRDPNNVVLTTDNSWCPECEEGNWREPGYKCRDCGTTLIAPKVHGKTWKTSFYRGITNRIGHRLYEERKKVEAETPASTIAPNMALAVRNLGLATRAENESYVEKQFGPMTNRRRSYSSGISSGYNAGARAGDQVSLRGRGLGSGAKGALAGG